MNADKNTNQQKNTMSDPYLLGLYLNGASIGPAITRGQQNGWFQIWKNETIRIVKAYKLTDGDLCATSGLNCEEVKKIVHGTN